MTRVGLRPASTSALFATAKQIRAILDGLYMLQEYLGGRPFRTGKHGSLLHSSVSYDELEALPSVPGIMYFQIGLVVQQPRLAKHTLPWHQLCLKPHAMPG